MAGLWYRVGTISVTNGSAKIIGFGSVWKSGANKPDKGHTFWGPDGKHYELDYVESDTVLYLVKPYAGPTASGQSYEIDTTRTSTIPALSREVSALLAYAQGQYDGWQAVLTGSGDVLLTAPDGQQVTVPSLSNMLSKSGNLSGINQPDVALGHLGVSSLMINAIKAGSAENFISAIGLGSGNLGFIPSHGNSTLSGILTLASFVSTGENHLALGAYTDPASSRSAAIKIGSGGLVVKGGIWSVDNQGTSPQDVVRYDYLDNNFYRKVSPGGVLEIGNMIDFHTSGDTSDYSLRLHAGNGYLLTLGYHSANEYRLPSDLGGVKPEGSSASPVTRLWGTNIASVTGNNEAILAFNANHTGAAWEKIDPAKSSHIISVSQYGLVHYSASPTDASPTQNSTILIDDGTLKSGTYNPIFNSCTAKNESHFALGDYSDPSSGRSAAIKIGSGGMVVKGGIWSVDAQGTSAQDVTRKDYVDGRTGSDVKLKSNITKLEHSLDKACALNGYSFDKIDWPLVDVHRKAGVIAQEVEAVLPEAIGWAGDEETGIKTVDPLALCGLLIEAVKELKSKVDDLEAIVAANGHTVSDGVTSEQLLPE